MNRRQFLQSAAAAGLALQQFPFGAFAAAGDKAPRVGLIGTGWYGKCDLLRLIQVAPVEVVSLCDVDSKMLDAAADVVAGRQASKKKPRTYGDYRDMLKEKDLDIVLIATPDHWHALPMIAAVESGADVYVQKPISLDVAEGKAMVAAARENKRVVQVGMQRRSTPHLIEARDGIVKEGKLGKVGLVEIYCYYHMRASENPPDEKPPPLDDPEPPEGRPRQERLVRVTLKRLERRPGRGRVCDRGRVVGRGRGQGQDLAGLRIEHDDRATMLPECRHRRLLEIP